MADEPKFIQIATSSVAVGPEAAEQIVDNLFALDEKGNVWQYRRGEAKGQEPHWYPLSTKRK